MTRPPCPAIRSEQVFSKVSTSSPRLLLLQPPRQPGEADQVGEAHREAAAGDLVVLGGLDHPAGDGGELAAPDVHQELLQLRQQQLDQRVGDVGAGQAGLDGLGEVLQEGVHLPAGQPGGGLAGGAGHLDRHRLAEQAGLDQAGEPAQGDHVAVGEGPGLADVGEAHGPPEAGRQLHRDVGGPRGLVRGVAAWRVQDQAFQFERDRGVVGPRCRAAAAVLCHRSVPVRSPHSPRVLPVRARPPPGGQWRASHRCQVECSHGIARSGASARVKER